MQIEFLIGSALLLIAAGLALYLHADKDGE